MLAKLKLALVAAVLGGLVVVSAQTGSRAAVPVVPLALTAEETEKFKELIDPATGNMDALVAWLETLRETHPDPGVIGQILLDLALLVEDDNPNKDTILAMIQDMLATAAGLPLEPAAEPAAVVIVGVPFVGVPPENPSTDNPSPVD